MSRRAVENYFFLFFRRVSNFLESRALPRKSLWDTFYSLLECPVLYRVSRILNISVFYSSILLVSSVVMLISPMRGIVQLLQLAEIKKKLKTRRARGEVKHAALISLLVNSCTYFRAAYTDIRTHARTHTFTRYQCSHGITSTYERVDNHDPVSVVYRSTSLRVILSFANQVSLHSSLRRESHFNHRADERR